MKRASLISVVLTVALAIACTTPTTNTNKSSSGYISPGTANPGLVTIAVVVTQDPAQTLPTVEVTDPSYASKKAQKIRWCVYNNTQTLLSQVSIVFTGGASPCDNNPTLTLNNIDAGNDPAVCTDVCGCIPTAGSFSYLVNVTTASGGHPPSPNPRVILN
jgi:hypothetical protein